MKDIPIDLAKELKDLGLTEEELKVVLSDLVAGPGVGPTTQPPADQDDQSWLPILGFFPCSMITPLMEICPPK